jgi:hypothetical protein
MGFFVKMVEGLRLLGGSATSEGSLKLKIVLEVKGGGVNKRSGLNKALGVTGRKWHWIRVILDLAVHKV